MSGFQNDAGVQQQEAGFGYFGRFQTQSYNDSMTAKAGGGRSGATNLDSMFCTFTTVASVNDSAVLPPIASFPGGALVLCVTNDAQNAITVFADGTDTVNGVAGATGVQQMGKSIVYYQSTKAGNWKATGLGAGYAGNQTTYSYADALIAFATGGQASATPITVSTARFTTVASAGDSAVLPAAAPGMVLTVINAGVAIMNLFPASQSQGGASGGDQINSLGQNAALALTPGAIVDLYTTVLGTWHAIVSTAGAPNQTYGTNAATSGTVLTGANICGGAVETFLDMIGTLGGNANAQLPTVAALVAALTAAGLNPQPGMSYELDIIERSAANTWTITTNTGWGLTGTMTLGTSGFTRKFIVTLTSLSAAVLRSVGSYTLGAA